MKRQLKPEEEVFSFPGECGGSKKIGQPPTSVCHTSYGWKKYGNSRFVFVATHGAGDDKYTWIIAKKLAERTDGSFIINRYFIRPRNSKASTSERVSDFNRISWSNKYQKYLWKKERDKKEFYDDIADICDHVQGRTACKPVVIHVHGMDRPELAIDLGIGLREDRKTGKLKRNTLGHMYTGKVTMPIRSARELRQKLERVLKGRYPFFRVGIGHYYQAFSKRMGVQFHKHQGRDDYAVQLEINKELKNEKEKRDMFIEDLASTLLRVFA